MKYLASVLAYALTIATPVFAQTQTPHPNTNANTSKTPMANASDDVTAKGFLTKAAQGGMAEVELAKMASTKASSQKVKAFASKLQADHTKANAEVKALAAKKSITLPTAMGAEHKAEHDKLMALSGGAFDRAYVHAMVEDHEKDVAEFKKQSTTNQDADVKAWAAKTVPTLEEHLRQVQQLDKELGAATN